MITVGKPAPNFKAEAVINGNIKTLNLNSFEGKYKVLFFYPLDFTFVCPTELHAFEELTEEFEKRNTQVIACSVDSVHSHQAWLNTPKAKGGIEGINYPILSDINKSIAMNYGALHHTDGIALRGLFIIDQNNVIQAAQINNLPLGRNVQEVLRLIDALQHHEKHGDVCPANWTKDKPAMQATQSGVKEYFNQ
ncbi:MAG TPA: peroxiredoxin [Candidatus Babeliales bacterium]|nr:peroxiredoxin [Candidatus Babeliales bacterium]